jgi:hypothetical protein
MSKGFLYVGQNFRDRKCDSMVNRGIFTSTTLLLREEVTDLIC